MHPRGGSLPPSRPGAGNGRGGRSARAPQGDAATAVTAARDGARGDPRPGRVLGGPVRVRGRGCQPPQLQARGAEGVAGGRCAPRRPAVPLLALAPGESWREAQPVLRGRGRFRSRGTWPANERPGEVGLPRELQLPG